MAFAGKKNQVLHAYGLLSRGADFGRNLESSPANTAAADFHIRGNIGQRFLPYLEAVFLNFFGYDIDSIVKNLISVVLLAPFHHIIDKFGYNRFVEPWIGQDNAFFWL